jgi:hypothetical protein
MDLSGERARDVEFLLFTCIFCIAKCAWNDRVIEKALGQMSKHKEMGCAFGYSWGRSQSVIFLFVISHSVRISIDLRNPAAVR